MKRWSTRHPGPADLALVVEIAESTISEDREMVKVYGPTGIPVYWIVDLQARQVEVYTLKRRSGYGKPRIFKPRQSVPVVIGGAEVGRIAVSEIVPTKYAG
jgi:Uma2 family endonuclease